MGFEAPTIEVNQDAGNEANIEPDVLAVHNQRIQGVISP